MQSQQQPVQELFEVLHVSSSPHDSGESSAPPNIMRKDAADTFSHRRRSKDWSESLNADEEIEKLMKYFVIRESQHSAQARTKRILHPNILAAALPPPVRFNRASRKTFVKLGAQAKE
jgi:hypothetical protein